MAWSIEWYWLLWDIDIFVFCDWLILDILIYWIRLLIHFAIDWLWPLIDWVSWVIGWFGILLHWLRRSIYLFGLLIHIDHWLIGLLVLTVTIVKFVLFTQSINWKIWNCYNSRLLLFVCCGRLICRSCIVINSYQSIDINQLSRSSMCTNIHSIIEINNSFQKTKQAFKPFWGKTLLTSDL